MAGEHLERPDAFLGKPYLLEELKDTQVAVDALLVWYRASERRRMFSHNMSTDDPNCKFFPSINDLMTDPAHEKRINF
jgi:hypothetical protein